MADEKLVFRKLSKFSCNLSSHSHGVTGLNLTGWVRIVNTGKSLSSREKFNLRQLSNFDSCPRKTFFLCVKVSSHVQ